MAAAVGLGTAGLTAVADSATALAAATLGNVEPFFGPHQGGILTPRQDHLCFAAFDLVTEDRRQVSDMLRAWTEAAWRMSTGETARPLSQDSTASGGDSGEAIGLPAARLTMTFGFGAQLFVKDGADRFGLARQRPEALVELPHFTGEQLRPEWTGGDLSVQACADDPQVAFHSVRQLASIGGGVIALRWAQPGFVRYTESGGTPRNLLGFKDGTDNPRRDSDAVMNRYIWVGTEGPAWMKGGSYVVVRRIRLALGDWDRLPVGAQEQVIGRHKYSGAPLGRRNEFDPLDLLANNADGTPTIPHASHVRLAARASYEGDPILRRPYSYIDGAGRAFERTAGSQPSEYDAGLLFIAYQRDPRTAFIPIFTELSAKDAMNRFATHVGSAVFACPPGTEPGRFIGQSLFSAAT